MEYKKNVRSPNYGRIFAYDQQGREIKELDVLRTILVHSGGQYTIRELLESVLENKQNIAEMQEKLNNNEATIDSLTKQVSELSDKVQTLSELAILLDGQIKSLQ